MKHLRYKPLLLTLLLTMAFSAHAQDSRNRVTSTIIADGLAQLPAQSLDALEQVMSEIAGTGAEGVEMLTGMLQPSDQGKNAPFQYAIDGLTSYVSQKGREAQADIVRKALEAAIQKCTDEGNRVFLTDQLAKLNPDKQVVEHATEDLKAVAANSRAIAELRDKVSATPEKKQTALLVKTLKSTDRQLRVTALELGNGIEGFADQVVKAYPKLKTDAQTDVLRWLGNRHDSAHAATVIAAITDKDQTKARAAIEAAGRIGGTDALTALIGQLGGDNGAQAEAALLAFNGKVNDGVLTALNAQGADAPASLVKIAGERRIRQAYPALVALLDNPKDDVRQAAVKAVIAVAQPEQYESLSNRPEVYYPLLAQRGTKEDIQKLVAARQGANKDAATAALLTVKKADVVAPLYEIAQNEADARDRVLTRALAVAKGANFPSLQKYQLYKQALEMQPSAAVQNKFLEALGNLGNEPALNLAAEYMDNKATDLAAAYAVTNLIGKNEPMQRGAHVRQMLLRAQEVFKSYAADNADAGYAVDNVNTILPKIVDDPNAIAKPTAELTAEEKAAGFELLFDGVSLDNWKGNKTDYVPIDGNIYVSAHYGSEGNLYTEKTYSDFVFRFEFCFVRPGINNGVGIRTSMGVDAAYEGMEIQILDHDDPIYAGLRPYQQHGAVYGIIVPEHVNFGPLGTWNTEEIRAEGDHITVTVNGRVILDGNIREACQGHNVAPEGEKSNPYTVDHQNHPGLFNPDGLICFCGHGEGLKLRNIRVLDLSAQKAAKKGKGKRK